ncbi:DNA polymerase IV [uncultured Cohaesibacter sp.]|uniref:DNA polymerase IV n=1 Tax=uncultured Cohaesibacter sp. TaxID=1002546 RepID=UPI002930CB8F|nr:DNA polymerase IV [uncultured Cohaesibacter sp.]
MTNGTFFLCRDCLSDGDGAPSRCPNCGSPRLVQHTELTSLHIAHIDCDSFYASVEKRDNPDIRDKPVIIGGAQRGVVATACYIARIRGVKSAMPMFQAKKLCPDAIIIRPNMKKYSAVGKEIRAAMQALTPLVEPLSIDEAFLDLSGTEKLHHAYPALTLARFAQHIEQEIGITVSVGLSHNKFLAKIASDFEKPRGFSIIGKEETIRFLKDKPVSMIWGVGKVSQKKLAQDGYHTIGQLQTADAAELASHYGSLGLRLAKLAHGKDDRSVSPDEETKSISAETTFSRDLSEADEILPILRRMSEETSRRAKKAKLAGRTITLKLKDNQFKSITRSRSLSDPTQLADRLYSVGKDLLLKELPKGKHYRLIGIGISELHSDDFADPPDLVDLDASKRASAEKAIDRLSEKFGSKIVELGLTLKGKLSHRDGEPPSGKEIHSAQKPDKDSGLE